MRASAQHLAAPSLWPDPIKVPIVHIYSTQGPGSADMVMSDQRDNMEVDNDGASSS